MSVTFTGVASRRYKVSLMLTTATRLLLDMTSLSRFCDAARTCPGIPRRFGLRSKHRAGLRGRRSRSQCRLCYRFGRRGRTSKHTFYTIPPIHVYLFRCNNFLRTLGTLNRSIRLDVW
jgi:hypothetical protein